MFPLKFPHAILSEHGRPDEWVLDPFCGRGTTNYAGRLLGLSSIGIDSSPVAVAIAQAKLANTSPAAIMQAAQHILTEVPEPASVPKGEFWEWAFEASVLRTLCRLREGLMRNCQSDARIALRAILMGALHGPRPKHRASYLSNQAPRTYAPKPRYAVNFWRSRGLVPEAVDVLAIIAERAKRYFVAATPVAAGTVLQADSREPATFGRLRSTTPIQWVITSPPYYGMRTYIPDQWLRSWLLGGSAAVDYSMAGQVTHDSPKSIAEQFRQVWRNTGACASPGARLVIRFGGINDRKADPIGIITNSLADTGWEITNIESAGVASAGRRQAAHFARTERAAIDEHDIWARWGG
jgi:hypothetical protein